VPTSELLKRVSIRRSEQPFIFSLDIAELDDKLSCHYYNPDTLRTIIELENCNDITTIKDISTHVRYSDGKWELKYTDYVPQEYPESVLLLQVSNLNSDGTLNLETGREKYIKRELHDKWHNSQVKPNNIVVAITGTTIGLSSIIPDNFPEANLNQALGIIELKESVLLKNMPRHINKEFVVMYLNCLYAGVQFKRYGGFRSGQSGLATKEIKSVLIPIPNNVIQSGIVNKNHKLKAKIEESVNQYDKTIGNISNLLESIFPIKYVYPKQNFFIDTLKFDRLDYLYNSRELKSIRSFLNNLVEQKKVELVSPSKYFDKFRTISKSKYTSLQYSIFKYIDIDNVDKDIGFIRGHQEDILLKLPTRARQIMKTNDVLVPSPIGSTKGIVVVPPEYNNQLCSTGFILLKADSYEEALMLFAIFKSTIMQRYLYCVQSGCIQPSVATNRLINDVMLPIPIGKYKKELLAKIREYTQLAWTLYSQISVMKQDLLKQLESDIQLLLKGQY
jgi:hypothetical protein